MKLVLCSEGFHTKNTIDACVRLVGKPIEEITVAIICEAYATEYGDKHWVVNNLKSVADNFSAEIDIVDLLALDIEEIEERLRAKDVIFVVGGQTDYYMKVMNESGLSELLPKLLEEKVYVGSSTGSMIIGRRLPDEAYHTLYQGGVSTEYGISEYLSLVNFAVIPHLDSKSDVNVRAQVIDELTKDVDFPVYGLKDDSAVVIDGDKQEFIGSKPHIASKNN